MGKLLNLRSNFQKVRDNVDQISIASMTEVLPDVEEVQREQFLKGQSSDGSIIGRYKSNAYAKMKFQLSGRAGYGIVDLTLHKDFSRETEAKMEGGKLNLQSLNEKMEWLGNRYGLDRIFGLNPESKGPFIQQKLTPAMMRNIRKIVRL